MIFFTQNIAPFNAENGMKVSPIPCELIDNRLGFYISVFWQEELEARGAITEPITRADLKPAEIF